MSVYNSKSITSSLNIKSKILDEINNMEIYDPETLELYNDQAYCTKYGIEITNHVWWWNHIFGHTLPTYNALNEIFYTIDTIFLKDSIILSIGSGKSLWEYLLKTNGCNIICTDIEIPNIIYMDVIKIDESDIYNQLIRKKIIKSIEDIQILFLCWPQPDLDEYGMFYIDSDDVYNGSGYDERALEKFKGTYVMFILNDRDDGIVGTLGAKRILARDYEKIKTIQLPYYTKENNDYNPSINIWKKI
jgi:hypothetical protein